MKADIRRVDLATTAIATNEDKSGFMPIDIDEDMVSFEKLLQCDLKARSGLINTLKKIKDRKQWLGYEQVLQALFF
jgi:hypothetical protein